MKRRPAPVKNPALARTIGEMILRAADTRPDFHFMNYFTPGGRLRRVSWARAMPQMAAIAAWWDAHGIQSGRRVCCITPNSPGMFVWEFAAMGTGRISAPLYGRTRPEEMRRLLPGLNPAAVLVEDAPVKTAVAALLGIRIFAAKEKLLTAFTASSLTILLVVGTGVIGLFPNLIPSNLDTAYSLTIFNSSSSPYTLKIMTVVAFIFVPIVIAYKIWVYRIFRAPVTVEDVTKSSEAY